MKKNLLAAASVMVLALSVVSGASAKDGFYMGLRGGSTNVNLNNKNDSVTNKGREDFDYTWHISGALGYKYKYVRVEAEYTYRDEIDDSYKYQTTGGPMGLHKVTLGADSIMANAYIDFMPNYWISPYIAGGIGMTRLELKNVEANGYTDNDKGDEFSWMLGAGLSLRLNRCVNFDAGYRYIDMGDLGDAEFNAHEVYGGLRFTF